MFSKINILRVITDHLKTLKGSTDVAPFCGKVFICDIALFYGFPLVMSVIVVFFGFLIPDKIINCCFIALSIFVPLLINVIFLIYSILEKAQGHNIEINTKISRVRQLLMEIFCNLSYSIFVSFMTIILLLLCMVECIANQILFGAVCFLMLHLVFTGLMIIKRVHILLMDSFNFVDSE